MRWRNGKSMCPQEARAHRTTRIRQEATLRAIGLPKELLNSTIRFSLSVFTTEEEIDYTVQVLHELVPMLRRFTRR